MGRRDRDPRVIVAASLAWATIWTAYFRRSVRVRRTLFSPQAE